MSFPAALVALPALVGAFAVLARPHLQREALVSAFLASLGLTFLFLALVAAGIGFNRIGWTRVFGDTIWLPADAAIASGILLLASPNTRGWRTLGGLGIVAAGLTGVVGTFLGFWFSIEM